MRASANFNGMFAAASKMDMKTQSAALGQIHFKKDPEKEISNVVPEWCLQAMSCKANPKTHVHDWMHKVMMKQSKCALGHSN